MLTILYKPTAINVHAVGNVQLLMNVVSISANFCLKQITVDNDKVYKDTVKSLQRRLIELVS